MRFVLFYIQHTSSCKILDVKSNVIKFWAKCYQRAAGEIRIRIRKIFSLTNFSEWFFVLLYGIFTLIIIYKNRKYWLYIFIK